LHIVCEQARRKDCRGRALFLKAIPLKFLSYQKCADILVLFTLRHVSLSTARLEPCLHRLMEEPALFALMCCWLRLTCLNGVSFTCMHSMWAGYDCRLTMSSAFAPSQRHTRKWSALPPRKVLLCRQPTLSPHLVLWCP
jgi:hypothetical protein